jgi:hypothetical protein
MSIIGHSIQSSVVNANSLLKEQLAAQAAVSDEEVKRQARIQHEEELAREAVQESLEAKNGRTDNATDRPRRSPQRGKDDNQGDGRHIDILA